VCIFETISVNGVLVFLQYITGSTVASKLLYFDFQKLYFTAQIKYSYK